MSFKIIITTSVTRSSFFHNATTDLQDQDHNVQDQDHSVQDQDQNRFLWCQTGLVLRPTDDGLRTILALVFNWNRYGSIGYASAGKHRFSNKNALGFLRFGSITFKMYFNYKIQITFLKSNANTFFNYFGYDGQNTKYIS